LTYSPSDHQIAFGTKGGNVYLWDLQSKEPCADLGGHNSWVQCIAYSPCGEWIASGSDDNTVGIWHRQLSGEVESWSRVHSICAFFDSVRDVAWNPVVALAPMEFVTGTWEGSVQMWRISIDDGGDVVVKMVWGSGLGTLCAERVKFTNTVGLDQIYQKLLVQRGALNLPEEL
jgi:WD40 repeat protein